MSMSIIFSAFALVIALFSLWVSYRSDRFAKEVAAAEKRTQIYSVFIGVWLEATELLRLVKFATKNSENGYAFPEGMDQIEKELEKFVGNIPGRLHWLSVEKDNDSVKLEEYKSYALSIEARMQKIGPMIREIKVETIE